MADAFVTYTGRTTRLTPPPADVPFAALIGGSKWGTEPAGGAVTVTFAFPESQDAYDQERDTPGSYNLFEPLGGVFSNLLQRFDAFEPAANEATIRALEAWSGVATVSFQQVPAVSTSAGAIRFAYSFPPAIDLALGGVGVFPQDFPAAGDVWLNRTYVESLGWADGSRAFETLLHEIGHALGLKHPHDFGQAFVPGWPATLATLPHQGYVLTEHSTSDTVMAYNDAPGQDIQFKVDFAPTTPMRLDIAALQFLYGVNAATRADDTVYTFDALGRYHQTVWDGGGRDALQVVGGGDALISLIPGSWSRIGLPLTYSEYKADGTLMGPRPELTRAETVYVYDSVLIEDAYGGAGNDTLIGNAANNKLDGGPGNDRLEGGDGVDSAWYASARAAYGLTRTSSDWTVTGPEGTDSLHGVERLHFADQALALDSGPDERAGEVAQILRALFGPAALFDPVFAGVGLSLFDAGLDYVQVVALAVASPEFLARAGSASNPDFVRTVFHHLVGRDPSASESAGYVALLDSGGSSQAALALLACRSELNLESADLLGVAASGLAYEPQAGGL